jgi:hypothetical protein
MNMKKLVFSILLLTSICTQAQLVVDFAQLSLPPGGRLNSWSLYPATMRILVSAQGGAGAKAILKTQIRNTDGTVVATTDLSRAQIYTFLGSAPQQFNASQILPLELMIFNGSYRNTFEKTGTLPAGTYQLCVQFVTPVDFLPLSQERCRIFNIRAVQLPVLMMPPAGAELNAISAQTAITFRWTPAIANINPVFYRLQVWEVLPGQLPVQAMRANQPLLSQLVTGTTQYIWRPQLLFDFPVADSAVKADTSNIAAGNAAPKVTKPFIWTVQAVDGKGDPVSDAGDYNTQGRAEPKQFFIVRKR